MKNSDFSALLVKYQKANKLNNTKFVANFIENFPPKEDSEPQIPEEPTPEIISFANTFVKKQAKCTDKEFSNQMQEIAMSDVEDEDFVPEKFQHYYGEY